jgi:hypothetical protein
MINHAQRKDGLILMISTVTVSTVSTVTTASIAGSVALIGILILLALLVQKELASAAEGGKLEKLGQVLNISIAPLMIAFVLLVITRVGEVLR